MPGKTYPYTDPASETSPVSPLLHALATAPSSASPLDPASVASIHLATLLFSHLLRSSSRAKALARSITPPPLHSVDGGGTDNFFVPADGAPTQSKTPEIADDYDEPPQTLLQILSENLSLSFLSRSRADTSERESREWDRLLVAYLCLLSQWLWEDPGSVREFLDAGGLGVVCRFILRKVVLALSTDGWQPDSWWNR
jgi:hypothetical protein